MDDTRGIGVEAAAPSARPGPSAAPDAQRIDFAIGGNGANLRGANLRGGGWSGQEADSIWTIGPASSLSLPPVAGGSDWVFDCDIEPCVAPPWVLGQLLVVSIGDHVLGSAWITGPCRLSIPLPALPQPWTLQFEHPGFIRLDRLGDSREDRPLAVRFFGARLYRQAAAATIDQHIPLRTGQPHLSLTPPPSNPTSPAPPAMFDFTSGHHAGAQFGDGWLSGSDDGVWSCAVVSHVRLPIPVGGGARCLRLGANPLLVQNLTPAQRVAIIGDGLLLGSFRLTAETVLLLPLPAWLVDERDTLALTFVLPDAVAMAGFANTDPSHDLAIALAWIAVDPVPSHTVAAMAIRGDELVAPPRRARADRFADIANSDLATAISAELGLAPAELMRGFESLGDNCAFGIAQRKAGAELLGLLRFANTPLAALQRGLADGFSAATRPADVTMYLHPSAPREYMMSIPTYGITWHTMTHEDDAPADQVRGEQLAKLAFLQRQWRQGVRIGRKIYVLSRAQPRIIELAVPPLEAPHRPPLDQGPFYPASVWDGPQAYEETPAPLCLAEALAILAELNRHAASTLLYLVPANADHPSGAVDLIAPGLMRGYLDSFVILPEESRGNDADWLRVAANAAYLHRTLNANLMNRAPPSEPTTPRPDISARVLR